jgi:DNA-binding CsgD family transcriptional regulator
MVDLSPREAAVFALIRRGMSYRQVAGELGISPHTAEVYARRCARKLPGHTSLPTQKRILAAPDPGTGNP